MDYVLAASQSPYGAKWFATDIVGWVRVSETWESQSPYGAKWFATQAGRGRRPHRLERSQSPYGAKWFATIFAKYRRCAHYPTTGRNPLTGLSGLQLKYGMAMPAEKIGVAIPLRG